MGLFSFFNRERDVESQPESLVQPTHDEVPQPQVDSASSDYTSAQSSGSVLTPVTQERIKAIFDSQGWSWFVDNQGDLGGTWDNYQFFFLLMGENKEILQIYSQWNRTVNMEDLDRVRYFIRQWHHDKLWPKCYHRIGDDGSIRVFTEQAVDWEHGATDDQLLQQIRCGLGTANEFYRALTEYLDD